MAVIQALKARQVLDSRGRPTVEVDVIASNGALGRAIVPSGASTGRHEAIELRDAGSSKYGGLGMGKAVENVRTVIAPAVAGIELDDQAAIDAALLAVLAVHLLVVTPREGDTPAPPVVEPAIAEDTSSPEQPAVR